MKKFLTILILVFTLQTPSQADDISDFEIEGMSIGDSLLDFFSEAEINEMYPVIYPESKKYIKLGFRENNKFDDYEHLTFHVEENDKSYVIHTIDGVIFFKNKLQKCMKKKKEVVKNLSSTLISIKPKEYDFKYKGELKGSIAYISDFKFNDGSSVRVWCVNWTASVEENKNFADSLSISMSPKYFFDWLNNEAYK